MIVVYVAGAYTADCAYKVKQNIWLAEQLGMKIVERFGHRGVMVIVPHTNTAHWEGIQSDEWFYEATEELLNRSDVLIAEPKRGENSRGTSQEIQHCLDTDKPYFWGTTKGLDLFSEWLAKQGM